MSKVRFSITMSIDGYIAGPNPSLENPLGEGGEQLHEWALALEAWRRPHGLEGGEGTSGVTPCSCARPQTHVRSASSRKWRELRRSARPIGSPFWKDHDPLLGSRPAPSDRGCRKCVCAERKTA